MTRRLTKRKRVPEAEQLPKALDVKHKIFMKWAQDRGVEINGVTPMHMPGRGVGLVTTRYVNADERILFVPEKAMFKASRVYHHPETGQPASPQAQLAINAMMACKQKDSDLFTWMATWPTIYDLRQSMPIYWHRSMRELLPVATQQLLQRPQSDYQTDWTVASKLCADNCWPEEDFNYYWVIVNSRSFHWKPRHGPGEMVMCPFLDYMNHGPTGTSCKVTQSPEGYEVVADRDYGENMHHYADVLPSIAYYADDPEAAGDEILATYGAHSNDKLLVHYGFVSSYSKGSPNADDDIRLDHVLLPKMSQMVKDQLQDVGFLGGYALLPASNELCFKTQVAVRALLLTCNEWEYFVANGEDLSEDQTPAVRRWIAPLLEKYSREAMQGLKDAQTLSKNHGEKVGGALMTTRWKQILNAIKAYLEA